MTLAIPTIHMNGTSRDELTRQLEEAGSALQAAIRAVEQACPNGRDYYTQGHDATQEALRQHANRLHNLTAVHSELCEIYEAIAA
jgi:hypothetical protein